MLALFCQLALSKDGGKVSILFFVLYAVVLYVIFIQCRECISVEHT